MLGEERADTPTYASLLSGTSSHLSADLEPRRVYAQSVASGTAPDEHRPSPERQGVGRGHGAPCSLGDPGFSDWSCAEGFRCEKLEDEDIGVCLNDARIGAPCEVGTHLAKPDPRRDFVSDLHRLQCGERMTCDRNISGFPMGSCASACSANLADGSCADFLDVDGFQNCLRFDFSHDVCAQRYVFAAGMRACDAGDPCRQDFVCVKTPEAGVGACVPPYFVFPLRLDGFPAGEGKGRRK
jgi:hypothetical protein